MDVKYKIGDMVLYEAIKYKIPDIEKVVLKGRVYEIIITREGNHYKLHTEHNTNVFKNEREIIGHADSN